tara:strand:+ start:5956 stop:6150 length:195 start_codon:yes stop_codon:yes gene_type:complete
MYVLIVYGDFEHKIILFVGIFKNLKSINEYSTGIIKYGDKQRNERKGKKKNYKSKKSIFEIVRI